MDEKQEPKKFETSFWQWTKGENAPNVETAIKEIRLGSDEFIVFESGTQVNKKLINDFVVQIPSLNEPKISIEMYLEREKITKQVTSDAASQDLNRSGMEEIKESEDVTNLGNADVIPHPDDAAEMMRWERAQQLKNPQVHNQGQHQQVQQQAQDPLIDLLEKSKKEKVRIKFELDVELPSNSFLQILLDSYEDKKDLILDYTLKLTQTELFNSELKLFLEKYIQK